MGRFHFTQTAMAMVLFGALATTSADASSLYIDFVGQTNPDTVFVTNLGLTKTVSGTITANTITDDNWVVDTTGSAFFYYAGNVASLAAGDGKMSINVKIKFESGKLPAHFTDFNLDYISNGKRILGHLNANNIQTLNPGAGSSTSVLHGVDLTDWNIFTWIYDPDVHATNVALYVNGSHVGTGVLLQTTNSNDGRINGLGDTGNAGGTNGAARHIEWIRFGNDTFVAQIPEPASLGLAAGCALMLLRRRA